MRLTKRNILGVSVLTKDGIPYSWRVSMKSNRVSDGRKFVNYTDGKTTANIEYPFFSPPASVQDFIRESKIALRVTWDEGDYMIHSFICKRKEA